MVKIRSIGTASKQTGILRPPLVLDKLGSDDFSTYSGWSAIVQSGTPSITAEGGYLKVKFTSSGYVLLGKKFNLSNTKHKAIYFKAMVASYTSTYCFTVGFWYDDGGNNYRLVVDKNEAHKLRIGYLTPTTGNWNESTVDLGTGVWYEVLLVLYKNYAAIYIPDDNGNYVALGKRWTRIAYLQMTFTNITGANTTVGIYTGTQNACEIWYDIVELYEAGGEGLKDPEILSVWEDGVRKPYRDSNGYYYVMVQLSATPTGSVAYGNGKLAVFRTTDLKDLSKYEYYMLIFEDHKVSGDFIVYGNYVVILYSDFSTGTATGTGRARISLSDFLNRNISALVDEGLIISGGYIDPKLFQDVNGGWHGLHTGASYRIFDLADPLSTPTNFRDMPSGWIEYPPYREHAGVLGVSDDNKLWGWLSATGGNNGVKFGKTDLSTWSDVYDPYYQDPDYTSSEAYDFVVDGSKLIGIYQVPIETLPTESGWVLFTLVASIEVIVPVPNFVLESISPTSISVKVGSTFTVNVTIRNDGADGTCKVSFIDHQGNVQDSKQQSIAGGSRYTFTLNGTAPNIVTKVTYTIRWEAV